MLAKLVGSLLLLLGVVAGAPSTSNPRTQPEIKTISSTDVYVLEGKRYVGFPTDSLVNALWYSVERMTPMNAVIDQDGEHAIMALLPQIWSQVVVRQGDSPQKVHYVHPFVQKNETVPLYKRAAIQDDPAEALYKFDVNDADHHEYTSPWVRLVTGYDRYVYDDGIYYNREEANASDKWFKVDAEGQYRLIQINTAPPKGEDRCKMLSSAEERKNDKALSYMRKIRADLLARNTPNNYVICQGRQYLVKAVLQHLWEKVKNRDFQEKAVYALLLQTNSDGEDKRMLYKLITDPAKYQEFHARLETSLSKHPQLTENSTLTGHEVLFNEELIFELAKKRNVEPSVAYAEWVAKNEVVENDEAFDHLVGDYLQVDRPPPRIIDSSALLPPDP